MPRIKPVSVKVLELVSCHVKWWNLYDTELGREWADNNTENMQCKEDFTTCKCEKQARDMYNRDTQPVHEG